MDDPDLMLDAKQILLDFQEKLRAAEQDRDKLPIASSSKKSFALYFLTLTIRYEQMLMAESKELEKTGKLLIQERQFRERETEDATLKEQELILRLEKEKTDADQRYIALNKGKNTEISSLQEQLASLENKLQSHQESARDEKERMQKFLDVREEGMQKLEQELNDLKAEHESTLKALDSGEQAAEDRISMAVERVKAERETIQQELHHEREENRRLRQEQEVSKEGEARLETQMDNLREQLKSMSEEQRVLGENLKSKDQEIEGLRDENRILQQKVWDLQKRVSERRGSLDLQLQAAQEHAAETVAKYKDREEAWQEERGETLLSLQQQTAKVEALEVENQKLKKEIHGLEQEVSDKEADHRAKIEAMMMANEDRIKHQEQGVESKIARMRTVEEQTRIQLQNMCDSQLEAFKSQIRVMEGKIADLEALCAEKEESISELNQAIEELEQEKSQELKAVEDSNNLRVTELQNEHKTELHRLRTHLEAEHQSLKAFIFTTARSMMSHVSDTDSVSMLGKSAHGAASLNGIPFSPTASYRPGDSTHSPPFRLNELERSHPEANMESETPGHRPLNLVVHGNQDLSIPRKPVANKEVSAETTGTSIANKENQSLGDPAMFGPSSGDIEPPAAPQAPEWVDG